MGRVRADIDAVLEYNSDLLKRHDPDDRNLRHPFFESGASNAQSRHKKALTTIKKDELAGLVLDND